MRFALLRISCEYQTPGKLRKNAEAESRGEEPTPEKCPSGWETDANGNMKYVLRFPYGIGVTVIEFEQFFSPE